VKELETIVRNTCSTTKSVEAAANFQITTKPNYLKKRALALIDEIEMQT